MAKGKKIPYEENHRELNGALEKKCSICNKWFPCNEGYFHKSKMNKTDGLYPYCKPCNILKNSKRQAEHKEERKEYDRKRLKENPDYFRENYRRYTKRHEEKIKQRVKEWQENNPDRIAFYNASRKEKNHNISKEEWTDCKEYFHYNCAYCGMMEEDHYGSFNQQLHKEHVDDNGANDLSNCIPSCQPCNSSKRNYTLQEWYNKKNPIHSKKRLEKINKWLNEDYKKYIKPPKPKGKYTKNPNNPRWKNCI